MPSEYIKSVRGVGRGLGAGSAKHDAPQPGDIRPPSHTPRAPQQLVQMPNVYEPARAPSPIQRMPDQPAPLTDGVVRCRVEEIVARKGGSVVMRMAVIRCPGCGNEHGLWTWKSPEQDQRPIWQFDGNLSAPTFSPSLLCFHTRPARDGQPEQRVTDCHTFIKGGWIQFLDDSSRHNLRGWHKLPPIGD